MRNWNVSALLILLYLATFWVWRTWPSRLGFVVVGLIAAGLMGLAIGRGLRRGYFASRIDLFRTFTL